MEGFGWAILIGECGLEGCALFGCSFAELLVLGRLDWSLELDALAEVGFSSRSVPLA